MYLGSHKNELNKIQTSRCPMRALAGDNGMARYMRTSKYHQVFECCGRAREHSHVEALKISGDEWAMDEWVFAPWKGARECFSKGQHAQRHDATGPSAEPQVIRCTKDLNKNVAELIGGWNLLHYRIWAFLQSSRELLFQIRAPGRQLADSHM